MTKEEIKKSVLDAYRSVFAIGNALGLSEADVAQRLYDDYEISYGELLAFKHLTYKEEEEENE